MPDQWPPRSSASGWSLHTRDRSPVLELDSDREFEPINIERDVDVLRLQVGSGWIWKAPEL